MGSRRQESDDALAVRIWAAWRQLRRGPGMRMLQHLAYGDGAGGFELGEVDALDVVASHPALRMTQVAAALDVDRSTATRAIDRLVRLGLVRRSRGRQDGRRVIVVLTPKGSSRHAAIAAQRGEHMSALLSHLTHREQEVLVEHLEKLLISLDKFLRSRRRAPSR